MPEISKSPDVVSTSHVEAIQRPLCPEQLYRYCSVYLFAGLGILLRIVIAESSSSIATARFFGSSYFIPNLLGCFCLGFLSQIATIKGLKRIVSPCLTSGFCGSLTTLSSWQLHVVSELLLKGYVFDAFINTIACCSAFYAMYGLGRHAFDATSLKHDSISDLPANTLRIYTHTTTTLTVLVALILVIILGVGGGGSGRPHILCALLGSLGALCRYKLSTYNPKGANVLFPYKYTLLANISGCIIIFIVNGFAPVDLQVIGQGYIWNDIMYAVVVGFCGSLTTVSSFIGELYKLNDTKTIRDRRNLYVYGITTFFSSQVLGCLILFSRT